MPTSDLRPAEDPQTEQLVRRAERGDDQAIEELFTRHRDRLRRMVAVRMDLRLAARVDASDVVQEALAEASRKLPGYLEHKRLPFYAWLRKLAWGHLLRLHRHHIRTQRRSVSREAPMLTGISDESAMTLSQQLVASGTGASTQAIREEACDQVRSALDRLDTDDREVLVMRHLEQLQIGEIAAILGISDGAVMMRRLRAFRLLRQILYEDEDLR